MYSKLKHHFDIIQAIQILIFKEIGILKFGILKNFLQMEISTIYKIRMI